MAEADVLDRIDIRWAVRTRTEFDTPVGTATALGSFLMTLGAYPGPATRQIMADNINARGVHDGDLEEVSCPGGAPSLRQATEIVSARGIRVEDIVEMTIQTVIVDDVREIAESQAFDEPAGADD
jgi:hypothetical protein